MITGAYDEHGYTVYHENEPLFLETYVKTRIGIIRSDCQRCVSRFASRRGDVAGEIQYASPPPGPTVSSTGAVTVTAIWSGDPKPEPDRLQVAERRLTILLWALLAAGSIAIALAYLAARRFWWA